MAPHVAECFPVERSQTIKDPFNTSERWAARVPFDEIWPLTYTQDKSRYMVNVRLWCRLGALCFPPPSQSGIVALYFVQFGFRTVETSFHSVHFHLCSALNSRQCHKAALHTSKIQTSNEQTMGNGDKEKLCYKENPCEGTHSFLGDTVEI